MVMNREKQIDRITRDLKRLSDEKYYGDVTVKMEAGNIVHIRYMHNEKIENIGEEEKKDVTAIGGDG